MNVATNPMEGFPPFCLCVPCVLCGEGSAGICGAARDRRHHRLHRHGQFPRRTRSPEARPSRGRTPTSSSWSRRAGPTGCAPHAKPRCNATCSCLGSFRRHGVLFLALRGEGDAAGRRDGTRRVQRFMPRTSSRTAGSLPLRLRHVEPGAGACGFVGNRARASCAPDNRPSRRSAWTTSTRPPPKMFITSRTHAAGHLNSR